MAALVMAPDRVAALATAIGRVRWNGAAGEVAAAVAARLAPFLGDADLLPRHARVPQAETYARNLLHADPAGRFSIWAMVWSPGQGSSIHDHRCWCVMGAHEGVLVEEAYRPEPARPERARLVRRLVCRAGATRALHPGIANIHRVVNDGPATAISIHVYGFDPAVACSSVGRVYAAG